MKIREPGAILTSSFLWGYFFYLRDEAFFGAHFAPSHGSDLVLIPPSNLFYLLTLSPQDQFKFRVAGGYSNQPPTNPLFTAPDENEFEESPQSDMFQNTLLARFQFGGYINVQLATDPDPPSGAYLLFLLFISLLLILMLTPHRGSGSIWHAYVPCRGCEAWRSTLV